jgi:hypothetical protein
MELQMPLLQKPAFLFYIASLLLAVPASAPSFAVPSGISLAGIEGRWSDRGGNLVLDVTACAEGLCGQQVSAGGQCGRTVMTLETGTQVSREDSVIFNGSYDFNSARTKGAMRVSVTIAQAPEDGSLKMQILGQNASLISRSLPFNVYLARTGEPVCRPAPVS